MTFMKYPLLLLLCLSSVVLAGQTKKILDHSAYHQWRKLENAQISASGEHIAYQLSSHGYADPIIRISNTKGTQVLNYSRGQKGEFSYEGDYFLFQIAPSDSSLRRLKRFKTKKADLPIDTLGIFKLADQSLEKIPFLKSIKVPKKWSDWIAFQTVLQPDTTNKKQKKSTDKNGYPLTLRQLSTGQSFTLPYVTSYKLSEEGGTLLAFSNGNDSTIQKGVYTFDSSDPGFNSIFESKGKYSAIGISHSGQQAAFVVDVDTTKVIDRNPQLYHWTKEAGAASLLLDSDHDFMPIGWKVNTHRSTGFSKNDQQVYVFINPAPIKQDTSLLKDEIVNVEVWSYNDPRLHTQQKIDAKNDREKGYRVVYNASSQTFNALETEAIPTSVQGNEGNANWSVGLDNQAYLRSRSWEGFPDYNDFYAIEHSSGKATRFAEKVRGSARISPAGKFAYWYDRIDSAWYTYEKASSEVRQITTNSVTRFFNEENDSPDYPSPYGVMTWTDNDRKMLIYDRFDIWEVDPTGTTSPINLTQTGKSGEVRYRYIKLDPEERFISKGQALLLEAFREFDKREGLISMTYGKSSKKELIGGDFQFTNVQKARSSDQVIYQKQSFIAYPDIWTSTVNFKKQNQLSKANPQQSEYNWGSAELIHYTSLDGKPLEGLLIKPENFNPTKKYPLLVNFYEKSSDGLHRHREPSPGRSTMNYSFYASRGYVIFNPDVHYREGYPGESAYNCVMPGITSLIEKGFIDKDRIGVQGHSWGGYQIAYLVTQTDLFRCAEAGAPVPNMISAYGGIRWWTGLSRMFQYEHTQSRIGGTLWQYPLRFIENSPIFFVDKINTPLLLMHNDADGHVPWYQGIELFVALRRLNKPSWMLNYQGEPHWPLKLQNRIDFNIRLQQYFDYYLQDAPMPEWMDRGVPAVQVGIDQNLELMSDQ